jgi:hypothetical protein
MSLPGSVGIIFSPRVNNIVSVLFEDSGSYTSPGEEDLSGGHELTKESFDSSFLVPLEEYNGCFWHYPNIKTAVTKTPGSWFKSAYEGKGGVIRPPVDIY